MELTNRFINDECVIVNIADENFGYPKTLVLKSHVSKLLSSGYRRVVLNMQDLQAMDSFGIAVIISLLKMCKEEKGNLALYGLNEQATRLMEITRMDRVLEIWETEGQALHQVEA